MLVCVFLVGFFIHVSSACQGRTCAQCIAYGRNCAWCSDESIKNPQDRCKAIDKFEGTCNGSLTFPDNEIYTDEDKNVTDGENGTNSVQIQPQKLTVKIRPRSKVTVPLRFRAARNYPVDLYFLFDLSYTMKPHKQKLANLAEDIADKIRKISHNFRLGFGYFQDKVILPFTNTMPAMLNNPCSGQGEACSPPYGYRHKLNFTTDVTMFTRTVLDARETANIDTPEGGLDAIMQAVMCERELEWRNLTRKLLIYSSDNTFHIAGDGKLAGIVEPNDGACHLNSSGMNPKELKQDYPSIGQLSHSVSEKEVFIIFAIASQTALFEYKKLSERIEGSSVDLLLGDSSNVVEIVKNKYEEIISEITLKVDAPPNVNVELRSDCNNKNTKTKTNNCKGLSIGTPVDFEVDILVNECPADPSEWRREVTITPGGLQDKMTIVLDIICQCDCENDGSGEVNSPKCSQGNGTYQCGVCSCNEGRYGQICQCSKGHADNSETDTCQSANNTVCSHRGTCECGECQCEPGWGGALCQCHDNICPMYRNQPCGGPLRGSCDCGTCQCVPGFIGDSCDCPISTDACLDNEQSLCSGKGTCVCGKCRCEDGYVGKLCDKCPTCPKACEESRPCAECVGFGTGFLSEEECNAQCGHVTKVPLIEEDESRACLIKDADGCTIKFKVFYQGDGNITVSVQEVKECPKDIDLVPIIAGVISGVVGVGILLLLLWKILTSVYDGMEYARFKEELENPRWGQNRNPIFIEATTTFNNPNFERADTEPFDEKAFKSE